MTARDVGIAGVWTAYVVMWVGGIVSYAALGGVREADAWAAPVFLGLAATIVLLHAGHRRAPRLLFAGILGFAAEWIGLRTGWLFGRYEYTDALAPSAFGVPVVMIAAWLILVAYADDLLRAARVGRSARILGGAMLLTAMDLVLDPLAAGPLGYWRWFEGGSYYGVPAHNFAGWFVVGLVVLTAAQSDPSPSASVSSLAIGGSVLLFFTVLAVVNGMAVPLAVGAGLLVCHGFLSRSTEALLTPAAPPPHGRW